MTHVPTALTIAGSDSGGGAGVQADLKTFLDHGVYGMSVITAITAQNTRAVTAVHVVPLDVIAAQLRAVLDDLPVGVIKLGMLADAAVIEVVARELEGFAGPIVLDPVLIAKSAARLLAPEAEAALVSTLVPRATVLTPNLPEADALLGGEDPAAFVARTGVALLLKDGHGAGLDVVDRLFSPGGAPRAFRHPRQETRNAHGTGCTLSSAIAARLARGEALEAAVEGGIGYVARLLYLSSDHALGAGCGPLLHGEIGQEED